MADELRQNAPSLDPMALGAEAKSYQEIEDINVADGWGGTLGWFANFQRVATDQDSMNDHLARSFDATHRRVNEQGRKEGWRYAEDPRRAEWERNLTDSQLEGLRSAGRRGKGDTEWYINRLRATEDVDKRLQGEISTASAITSGLAAETTQVYNLGAGALTAPLAAAGAARLGLDVVKAGLGARTAVSAIDGVASSLLVDGALSAVGEYRGDTAEILQNAAFSGIGQTVFDGAGHIIGSRLGGPTVHIPIPNNKPTGGKVKQQIGEALEQAVDDAQKPVSEVLPETVNDYADRVAEDVLDADADKPNTLQLLDPEEQQRIRDEYEGKLTEQVDEPAVQERVEDRVEEPAAQEPEAPVDLPPVTEPDLPEATVEVPVPEIKVPDLPELDLVPADKIDIPVAEEVDFDAFKLALEEEPVVVGEVRELDLPAIQDPVLDLADRAIEMHIGDNRPDLALEAVKNLAADGLDPETKLALEAKVRALDEFRKEAERPLNGNAPVRLFGQDGNTINLWSISRETFRHDDLGPALAKGEGYAQLTNRQILEAVARSAGDRTPSHVLLGKLASALLKKASPELDAPAYLMAGVRGEAFDDGSTLTGVVMRDKSIFDPTDFDLDEVVRGASWWTQSTLVHEVGHSMTLRAIAALETAERTGNLGMFSLEAQRAWEVLNFHLDALRKAPGITSPSGNRLSAVNGGGSDEALGHHYAAKNMAEFVAQLLGGDQQTTVRLSRMKPMGRVGWVRSALDEIKQAVKSVVFAFGWERQNTRSAYTDAMEAIDILIDAQIEGRNAVHVASLKEWKSEAAQSALPPQQQVKETDWLDSEAVRARDRAVKNSAKDAAHVNYMTSGLYRNALEASREAPGLGYAPDFDLNHPTNLRLQAVADNMVAKWLPDQRVTLTNRMSAPGLKANGEVFTVGTHHIIGINKDRSPTLAARTLVHEIGHAVLHAYGKDVSPELLVRMRASMNDFLHEAYSGSFADAKMKRYSVTSTQAGNTRTEVRQYDASFDEFGAEQFVKHVEQALTRGEGERVGLFGKAREMAIKLIEKARSLFSDAKVQGFLEPDAAFSDFFSDVLLRNETAGLERDMAVRGVVNPVGQVSRNKRTLDRLRNVAQDFETQHSYKRARTSWLARHASGLVSDGLVMSMSKSPIMRMYSAVLAEVTTGGAYVRRTTAAVRKHMLQQRIIGRSRFEFNNAMDEWAKLTRTPAQRLKDSINGNSRREFNRLVYAEIVSRRYAMEGKVPPVPRKSLDLEQVRLIREAADAAESLFDRARIEQKRAGTLGNGALGDTSVGYVPQRLDGKALIADPVGAEALKAHLADNFAQALQWSPEFSREFSKFYVERAIKRARGGAQDMVPSDQHGTSVVREALKEFGDEVTDPKLQKLAKENEHGLAHTRGRLDVDLLAYLPDGRRVMDLYVHDVDQLMARYTDRVSGDVALSEVGVLGRPGRNAIENALLAEPGVTAAELAAFRRVMDELQGLPVDAHRSVPAQNLRLLTGAARLGGMAWNQLGETTNALHMLGLNTMLRAPGGILRNALEIRRLIKGDAPTSKWLNGFDQVTGQFGLESHYTRFPADMPDERFVDYAESAGLTGTLLRRASHWQSKLSLFRAIHGAQHRYMAEEVVRRAAAYLVDSANGKKVADRWLDDMGFTAEMRQALAGSIHNAAAFDGDKVVGFDLSKLGTPQLQQDFAAAVHRGVAQIIQDTFVGEKAPWMHNDWGQLIGQFRSFTATAMEKQWLRTRYVAQGDGNVAQGYAALAGIILVQASIGAMLQYLRVQAAAAGRSGQDRKDYVDRRTTPWELSRAALNYSSTSGLFGDMMDILGAVGQGVAPETMEDLGKYGASSQRGNSGGSSPAEAVPVVGYVNDAGQALTDAAKARDREDWAKVLRNAARLAPGSNLPFVAPTLDMLRTVVAGR